MVCPTTTKYCPVLLLLLTIATISAEVSLTAVYTESEEEAEDNSNNNLINNFVYSNELKEDKEGNVMNLIGAADVASHNNGDDADGNAVLPPFPAIRIINNNDVSNADSASSSFFPSFSSLFRINPNSNWSNQQSDVAVPSIASMPNTPTTTATSATSPLPLPCDCPSAEAVHYWQLVAVISMGAFTFTCTAFLITAVLYHRSGRELEAMLRMLRDHHHPYQPLTERDLNNNNTNRRHHQGEVDFLEPPQQRIPREIFLF